MSWGHASRLDVGELDSSWDSGPPLRAKAVIRRAPPRWEEREGVWSATIGRWAVRVVERPDPRDGWEWFAFSQGRPGSRALRCTGFRGPEPAQRDAEGTLSRTE
jgi:hypothetical protein